MNCEQIETLLELYVVEALDPAEQAMVEQHLADCPACRQQVHELTEVVHALPEALAVTTSLEMPADLKQQILRAAEADEAEEAEPPAVSPTPPQKTSSATSPNGKPQGFQWQRPPLWRGVSLRGVPAPLVLGVLLLLILAIFLGARLSTALAQERALRAELTELFGQQEIVLEVVDSDKTVRRVLTAPQPTSTDAPPYGKLFTRTDLPHVVAMIARLPQPPEGEAYHLWLTRNGQTRLAGIMAVNDDGFSLLAFDAPESGPVYDAAELRLQPVGSESPGGEMVLRWVGD